MENPSSQWPVTRIMSHPVIVLQVGTPVDEALEVAEERGVHHFPVLNGGKVVGLVCTCDLEEAPLTGRVGSVMRRPVIRVDRGSAAGEAARVMSEHGVGSALVMDADEVCGVVTRQDLARAGGDLEAMLPPGCTSCGSREHLRTCPDGAVLCVDCRSRAREHEWADLGGDG
jgi:CBS domain-containing protein